MTARQFLLILSARRFIIIVSMLAAMVAASYAVLTNPARYTANSRLMFDILRPDPVTGQTISSKYASAYIGTQAELIGDYRTLGKVVDAFGWTSSPQMAEIYQASVPDGGVDFRRWLAGRIAGGLQVGLLPESNILEISYTSNTAESAALVADAVRQAFMDQTIAFRRESAAKSATGMEAQLVRLKQQLADAQQQKTDYERKHGIVLGADAVDLDSARLAGLASTAPVAGGVKMSAAPALPSPSSAELAGIDAAIASALKTLGPNHPELIALRQRRAIVAAGAAQGSAPRAPQAPISAGPSIEQAFAAQRAKVLGQREFVLEAKRLAEDVARLTDTIKDTGNKLEGLRQQSEATETGLAPLGNADIPKSPSFPNLPFIIIGTLVLGLTFGSLTALLIEFMSRHVRGEGDLFQSGLPVLGVIPQSNDATVSRWRQWLGLGPGMVFKLDRLWKRQPA